MSEISQSDKYDLAVIGGGISGLGIALEAKSQGLKTAIIEKNFCCEATSNNSLRIIHGGFRYLQNLDLPRLIESSKAQAKLIQDEPDFVKPLRCLMPLKANGLKSKYPVHVALLAFQMLLPRSAKNYWRGGVLKSSEVDEAVPLLKGHAPHGALLWTDATLLDPLAFANQIKDELIADGISIFEQSEVRKIVRVGTDFLVSGGKGNSSFKHSARSIVNATGPWLGTDFGEPSSSINFKPKWCRGFNLVLSKSLESSYAIGLEGSLGRLYFIVPRANKSVVGTWYTPFDGKADEPHIEESEIAEFLKDLNPTLPNASITMNDIESVEVGVLPMESVNEQGPVLYGVEKILGHQGYIEVMSTKYTTFQSQARKVVNRVQSFLN